MNDAATHAGQDGQPRQPTPPAPLAGRQVALVHDWLTGMRGGERVLEVLCELFPDASLHTLLHVPGSVSPTIERHRPHTSFLQQIPGIERIYRHLLPLYSLAIEHLDVGTPALVISTSHCAVKSVPTRPGVRHLCYCFTPVRYAWDQFDAYFGPDRVGRVRSAVMRRLLDRFARWDQRTSPRPDRYVAISQYVARRIQRYYNRRSAVVYPPADTRYYTPDSGAREPFALVVSALVPYKRVDIAVAACRRAGVPLRIVGQGPEARSLARLGGSGVEFLGALRDDEVRALYRRAAMVLLPGEEDFGLVPVEAQACGTPVVALGRGGATETVVDGVTGALTADGVEAFAAGIRRVRDTVPADPAACRAQAERFSSERFVQQLTEAVTDLIQAAPDAVRW